MSVVVVVRKENVIAIGADTLSKSASEKLSRNYKRNSTKVFRYHDTYFGVVGASVHQDVLASALERHGSGISFDSRAEIFESYRKLHPILKDEYFLNPHEREQSDYESSQITALIANPHGVFGMFSWRTVTEYERFYAVGSGEAYAMGAMHAVYDRLPAKEVAEAGLAAACEFDDGSGLPFEVFTMAMREPKATGAASGWFRR